jgi:hypothetical protein
VGVGVGVSIGGDPPVAVRVGVVVTVGVADAVEVAIGATVWVGVAAGIAVPVRVGVKPADGVEVGVTLAVGVAVAAAAVSVGVGVEVGVELGVAVGRVIVGSPAMQRPRIPTTGRSTASQRLCGVHTSKSSQDAPRFVGSHAPVLGLHCSQFGKQSDLGAFTSHWPVSKLQLSVHRLPSVSGQIFGCGLQTTTCPANTSQVNVKQGLLFDPQGCP